MRNRKSTDTIVIVGSRNHKKLLSLDPSGGDHMKNLGVVVFAFVLLIGLAVIVAFAILSIFLPKNYCMRFSDSDTNV